MPGSKRPRSRRSAGSLRPPAKGAMDSPASRLAQVQARPWPLQGARGVRLRRPSLQGRGPRRECRGIPARSCASPGLRGGAVAQGRIQGAKGYMGISEPSPWRCGFKTGLRPAGCGWGSGLGTSEPRRGRWERRLDSAADMECSTVARKPRALEIGLKHAISLPQPTERSEKTVFERASNPTSHLSWN